MKLMNKRLRSALSIICAAIMCAVMLYVPISVGAEKPITQVNFDWGNSADLGDMHTVAVSGDSVAMPGAKPVGTAYCAAGFNVSNLTGWKNGDKFFPVGEASVAVDKLQGDNGVATLTAVYGDYTNNYNSLSAFKQVFSTGALSVASTGGKDGSVGVSLKAKAAATNNGNFRQHIIHTDSSAGTTTPYYNLGASYKVTFDYKVLDVKSGTVDVNFLFGAVTPNGSSKLGSNTDQFWTYYAVRNNYVSSHKILSVNATSDWKTHSVTLTAPDTYNATVKNDSHMEGTVYGRGMGIGLTGPTDANIVIDNIRIVPVEVAFISGVSDINDIEMTFDSSGNLVIPEAKTNYSSAFVEKGVLNLMWKNGDKYYKPGETVNKADLVKTGSIYKFTAYFGAASVTFNGLQNNVKFYQENKIWYGTGNFQTSENDQIGEKETPSSAKIDHECIDLISGASANTHRNALLFATAGTGGGEAFNPATDKAVHFEPGKEYTVTLRYRSYVPAKFYVTFGLPAGSDCGNGGVHKLIADTVAGNSSSSEQKWHTVSATVTAPTADKITTTRMGISVMLASATTADNQVRVDDITVVPTSEGKAKINFDLGDGAALGDIITKEYGISDAIDLALGGVVSNLKGWNNGNTFYSVSDVLTANDIGLGKEITLTAVYGKAEISFDGIETGMNFGSSSYYYGTGAASIAEADSTFGSGKYVSVTTNNNAYRQFLIFDKKGTTHTYPHFIKDEIYLVTLDYTRTDALAGNESIYFAFGVHTGDNSGDSGQTNIKRTLLKSVAAGESGKIEAFVVAPTTYKWVGMGNIELTSRYMAIGFEGKSGATLKFDNVSIEPMSSSDTYGVIIADLGNGETKVYSGQIGSDITVPAPLKDGAEFKGWYSDAACSDGNEVSAPKKVSAGVTRIYAKFEAKAPSSIVTFDDMPDRLFNPANSIWTTSSCYTIVAGKGVDGSKALRRQLTDGSAGAKPTALNYGQDNMLLESNTVYKVTFSYFIETAGGDLSVSMMAGGANGSWSGSRVFFGENIFLEKTTGKWLEKTFYFATGTLNSKAAYFCVAGGGNSAVSYYDNIEVTKISSPAVALIDYGYDGKQDVIEGKVGDALNINIPAPSKDAVLIGYFSDSAYKNKIDTLPTTLTAGVTSIYAYWFIPQKSIVTFEDYPKEHLISDAATGVYTSSSCYSIASGKGVKGSKALVRQLPKSDSQAKPQILSIGGEPVRLASNTTYKVSFSYYLATAGTVKAGLLTGGSASSWNNRKIHAQGVGLSNVTGKWHTVTFYVTTGSISQNCAYLTLAGGGMDTVMYVDNVEISTISPDETIMTLTVPVTGDTQYIVGKKGAPLTLPTVKGDKNTSFVGWFADKEFTTPYTAKVFPDKHTTVYGNVTLNKTLVVGFDDYPFDTSYGTAAFAGSIGSIPKGISSDGDGYAVKLDNTGERQGTDEKGICLNLGKKGLALENGVSYLISYDIRVAEGGGTAKYLFKTSSSGNMWGARNDMTAQSAIQLGSLEKNKWYTYHSVGTANTSNGENCLLMRISLPIDVIVYIDNVTVTKLGENEVAAVFVNSAGISPKPIITTKGKKVTMPNITAIKNKILIGWSYIEEEPEKIIVSVGAKVALKESIVFNTVVSTDNALEDFEKPSYPTGIVNYSTDHDWEIYDSALKGNSKANVKSGRYSLHRIGAEPSFKAYQFQRNNTFADATLVDAATYTISMWVKVEKPVHTKGSIALTTAQELGNPWNYMGDPLHIAAIKDVADGEWHQISCVLKAAGPYLTIIVPGNLSIFIDDLYIDNTPDAAVTDNVSFEEYIPAFLNEKGEYVVEEGKVSLIDFELVERTEVITEGKTTIIEEIIANPVALWLIIAGAAVIVLGAAAVVVMVILKKRKSAKEVK